MQNQPQIKRLAVFAGLALLVLILIVSYLLIIDARHAKLAKVILNAIPDDSLITIDGAKSKTGTKYLQPGRHVFVASKTGFKTYTVSLDTEKGQMITINLLPGPNSPAAYQWLADNPDIQTKREGLASQNVAYIQQALQKNYPIIKDLPLYTVNYKIDYGQSIKDPSDPTKIALYIEASPIHQSMALDWIKYKGYDPSNFEVVYQLP